MAVSGRTPELALVVTIREILVHRAKCTIRTGVWDPGRRPDLDQVPSLARAIVDHASPDTTVGEVQTFIDKDLRERLC
jgi:hypothetical protein